MHMCGSLPAMRVDAGHQGCGLWLLEAFREEGEREEHQCGCRKRTIWILVGGGPSRCLTVLMTGRFDIASTCQGQSGGYRGLPGHCRGTFVGFDDEDLLMQGGV